MISRIKRKISVVIILALCLCLAVPPLASANRYGFGFTGVTNGKIEKTYMIILNGNTNYRLPILNAVVNWNSAVEAIAGGTSGASKVDVNLREVTNESLADIVITVDDFGNTGIYGQTYFFLNGVGFQGPPKQNYNKVRIAINSNPTPGFNSAPNVITTIVSHELGHSFGLDHTNVPTPTLSIMWAHLTDLHASPSIEPYDVTEVRSVYAFNT